jgi:hypothetical protein
MVKPAPAVANLAAFKKGEKLSYCEFASSDYMTIGVIDIVWFKQAVFISRPASKDQNDSKQIKEKNVVFRPL